MTASRKARGTTRRWVSFGETNFTVLRFDFYTLRGNLTGVVCVGHNSNVTIKRCTYIRTATGAPLSLYSSSEEQYENVHIGTMGM